MTAITKIKKYSIKGGSLYVTWQRPRGMVITNILNDWAVDSIVDSFIASNCQMQWDTPAMSQLGWMPNCFLLACLSYHHRVLESPLCQSTNWNQRYQTLFHSNPSWLNMHRSCCDSTLEMLGDNEVSQRWVYAWFLMHSAALREHLDTTLPGEIDYMHDRVLQYDPANSRKRKNTTLAHQIRYFLGTPEPVWLEVE